MTTAQAVLAASGDAGKLESDIELPGLGSGAVCRHE